MTNQSSTVKFIEWAAGEFYTLYRKDREKAIDEAKRKVIDLEQDDKQVMALAYANTASRAIEMGSFLGGGKLVIWLVAGIASAVVYVVGAGVWAALPLGFSLLLALRDYWVCRSRSAAYRLLSSLLS